jgi:GNAT superfamily N-acetyltransferase
MELRFFDEPREFLHVAGDHLARQPVVSTVVATVAERIVRERTAGIPWPVGVPCWFVAVLQDGDVLGAAMRTAPFGAYPLFLLPMPEDAARELAHVVLKRNEQVSAANGALPAVQLFCDEIAARRGGSAEVALHTRLFELDRLVEPPPIAGRLRPAQPDEEALVTRWYDAFIVDADEQGGRPPGASAHEAPEAGVVRRNMQEGRILVWEDISGKPVSLVGASQPAYGVSRVGPVYTPPNDRGRGFASAAVAEVSRRILAQGARACLFTDQANPTSNKIYQRLGYRAVVDMAEMVVSPTTQRR